QALLEDPFAANGPRLAFSIPVLLANASNKADGNRCLANRKARLRNSQLQTGATRMRNCDPLLSHHQWLLRDDGLIQTTIADACLTAKPDKKVLIEACNSDDPRQIWTRVGDRFRVEIDGVKTCLTPGKNGLNNDGVVARHIACDEVVDHQRWLAFSLLQSGRPVQIPVADAGVLSVEAAEELAEQVQEVITGGQCVAAGSDRPSLTSCSRYKENQLWAHGEDGQLRCLEQDRGQAAIGTSPTTSSQLVFVEGTSSDEFVADAEAVAFDRTREADGSSIFVRRNNGDVLFAGATEQERRLFVDSLLVDDGADFVFWQHFSGGKFADGE
ncbi:MAG: ricin-type beta-trefoil lectin domain protein, partial [Myxococcota bacterium]